MAFGRGWFGCWAVFDDDSIPRGIPPPLIVNPSTGLPMAGDGLGGVDFGGSPFGSDIHHHELSFHHLESWTPSSTGYGFNND